MKIKSSTRLLSLLQIMVTLTAADDHPKLNRVALFEATQKSTITNNVTQNAMYANNPISTPF